MYAKRVKICEKFSSVDSICYLSIYVVIVRLMNKQIARYIKIDIFRRRKYESHDTIDDYGLLEVC
jgi:hypothetical protein